MNDTYLASLHRYERRYDVPDPDGRRNTLEHPIAVVPFLPAGVGMVGLVYSDFLRPRPGRRRLALYAALDSESLAQERGTNEGAGGRG